MSLARSASGGFAPKAETQTYRNILRFEQRLLQNAQHLAAQRRKYQAFLAVLVLCIAILAYRTFLRPSIYPLVHYCDIGLLLIAVTSFVLFFATGMYTEKISRAYKFVPQTNRSLRPLNMHLNTRTSGGFSWFRKRRGPQPRSAAMSPVRSPKDKPERPTSPGRQAGQAIPPASNPRGELIFSNRVDAAFRDGYEQYRADWERRRKDKPAADGSPQLTQRRTYSSKTGDAIDMDVLDRSRLTGSTESTPQSSRSPSPDYGHSRPSSGASTSGPPSPRSLHSTEDLFYRPLNSPGKDAPQYEEFFDDDEHQIRV